MGDQTFKHFRNELRRQSLEMDDLRRRIKALESEKEDPKARMLALADALRETSSGTTEARNDSVTDDGLTFSHHDVTGMSLGIHCRRGGPLFTERHLASDWLKLHARVAALEAERDRLRKDLAEANKHLAEANKHLAEANNHRMDF